MKRFGRNLIVQTKFYLAAGLRVGDGAHACDANGGEVDAGGIGGLICLVDAGTNRRSGQVVSGEK